MTSQPNPFPYEDHELGPVRHRRLAQLERDTTRALTPEPTAEPADPWAWADRAATVTFTIWGGCVISAIGAGVALHERSGPWVTGAVAVALATAAIGWTVSQVTYWHATRKGGQS